MLVLFVLEKITLDQLVLLGHFVNRLGLVTHIAQMGFYKAKKFTYCVWAHRSTDL
jgi:hypothetical protein